MSSTSQIMSPMHGPMVRRDLTSCPRPGLSRVINPCYSQNSAPKIVCHLHLHIHFGSRCAYLTIPVEPRVTWLYSQATLKLQGQPPYIFLKQQCFPLQLITHSQVDHETGRRFCRLEDSHTNASSTIKFVESDWLLLPSFLQYQPCACSSNSDRTTPLWYGTPHIHRR